MDLSSLLDSTTFKIILSITITILIVIFSSAWGKGYLGETRVKFNIWLLLNKSIYHPVHNVTLPTANGTTQIDHVLVSRFGIFVLETKNMKGMIFGKRDEPQWTQKIYKKKYKFQNPLRQNEKHVNALASFLKIPPNAVHSVVVFVGHSTLVKEMPPEVTRNKEFISYIKSFRAPVFTEAQVSDLLRRIEAGRLEPTIKTHLKHVQNLKNRSNAYSDQRCPECDKKMVLRTVKKGANAGQQFWGCKEFPNCRGTKSV